MSVPSPLGLADLAKLRECLAMRKAMAPKWSQEDAEYGWLLRLLLEVEALRSEIADTCLELVLDKDGEPTYVRGAGYDRPWNTPLITAILKAAGHVETVPLKER